jgi:dihydroflavonol-4-reductase
MRVAVTGATGHLGANVVRAFLARGATIRAIARRVNTPAIAGLALDAVSADVLDLPALRAAFTGCDVVVHLAAKISIRGDRDGAVRRTNVEGTRNALAAARSAGVGRFVHVSSIHAMKLEDAEGVADESLPLVGEGAFAYDLSKADGERIVRGEASSGMNAIVLRPTGILGPHDYMISRAGTMLREFFRGERPLLIPGGYDWVDVRDVAAAVASAATRGRAGQSYLISGQWVSIEDLARLCGHVSGCVRTRLMLPSRIAVTALPLVEALASLRSGEPLFTRESLAAVASNCRNISSRKAAEELGFTARPVAETLRDTFDWLKSGEIR